jgi:hypothetical protein
MPQKKYPRLAPIKRPGEFQRFTACFIAPELAL